MRAHRPAWPERVLAITAAVLTIKVTANVLSNYASYFPPDFASDFPRGRERDFLGAYRWAFYTHILSEPVSLIVGLVLVGERFRTSFPKLHRHLGRFQVACV